MSMIGPKLDMTELSTVAVIAASNIVLNRALPRGADVPAGLAAASIVALMALRSGATVSDVGLDGDARPTSVRLGLSLGVPIGTAIMLGAFSNRLRRFYDGDRMASTGLFEALYQFGIRIPIATAAAEEIIFRGGLEAVLRLRRSPEQAALLSSLLFGFWHVLPTLDRMDADQSLAEIHDGSLLRRAAGVATTVAFTFAAGLGFSLLRRRTGSILAPIIVHASFNGGGYIGSWLRSSASRRT
jgi:membrane protease YdiL (CAAX protease family)